LKGLNHWVGRLSENFSIFRFEIKETIKIHIQLKDFETAAAASEASTAVAKHGNLTAKTFGVLHKSKGFAKKANNGFDVISSDNEKYD